MRKLVYCIAATADGFIAAPDGSYDAFLLEGPHIVDLIADYPETFPTHLRAPLGLTGPSRRFDTVLMGRATYEVGVPAGVTSPYGHLEQYVFSASLGRSPDPSVQRIDSDALGFVRKLKERAGRDIWLCGGGQLASTLYDEIDELILKSHPTVLGAGIPLFGRAVKPKRMTLGERKVYDNGCLRLHYTLR
jgi:dihydrofolate reductase